MLCVLFCSSCHGSIPFCSFFFVWDIFPPPTECECLFFFLCAPALGVVTLFGVHSWFRARAERKKHKNRAKNGIILHGDDGDDDDDMMEETAHRRRKKKRRAKNEKKNRHEQKIYINVYPHPHRSAHPQCRTDGNGNSKRQRQLKYDQTNGKCEWNGSAGGNSRVGKINASAVLLLENRLCRQRALWIVNRTDAMAIRSLLSPPTNPSRTEISPVACTPAFNSGIHASCLMLGSPVTIY